MFLSRKFAAIAVAVSVAMVPVSVFAEGETAADPSEVTVKWKDTLRFETADGRFDIKFGGRLLNDWGFFSADDEIEELFGPLENGTEFRRARLFMSGTIHDRIEFKVQYDFTGGDAEFKDVYVGVTDIPGMGGIRVGHFKEPFGLEELTSSKYVTFTERSLTNAFVPSRNSGIMFHNHDGERFSWAVGTFRDTDDFGFDQGDGEWAATGRLTWAPVNRDDGRLVVHLGGAVSHRETADSFRFRERPETHLVPRFVDTGSIEADALDLLGGEFALVAGPFSLQAEYMQAEVDTSPASADPSFSSWYGFASLFLTGEHRPYKGSAGEFSRVRPRHSVFEGGAGAWELVARVSYIDLDDGDVYGGTMDDVTVGFNWHLNGNTRVLFNWVRPELDGVGEADLMTLRFHVDF